MKRICCVALIALAGWVTPAAAQTCDDIYVVEPGDTLSGIADRMYKDAGRWVRLHRENADAVGGNPDILLIGTRLRVECLDAPPDADVVTQAPLSLTAPEPLALGAVNLVTAGGFAPFADRALDQGGMIAQLVEAAMTEAGQGNAYQLNWVNDRAAHLDPLMREGLMDMAFPWPRPDCARDAGNALCRDFLFSDPMFEVLVTLFVDKRRPVPFATDSDIEGRTLCRPAGFSTYDLDRPDRLWISGGKITLKQPANAQDCFAMLVAGDVDAVAINDFTGRATIRDMGLSTRVEAIQGRVLSVETLHVLVAKSNPQADGLLAAFNDGLQRIRASGAFQQVLDRHLAPYWASF